MQNRNPRIGIVDDDQRLVGLVTKYLAANGFPEVVALTPRDIIDRKAPAIDLLILDIMMPEISGLDVIRHLRRFSDIGVIFLSAKNEVFDRIVGLELGADDYLTKPFEPRELLARIQAILRRKPAAAGGRETPPDDRPEGLSPQVDRLGRLRFQEFCFDQDRQLIERQGKEFPLSAHEFHLLRLFCANPNIVLSRHQITTWLESQNFGSYDRSIDVGISRLRRKLEPDPRNPAVLKTIWGRGYQLVVTKN